MPHQEVLPASVALIGRDGESAAIEALIDAAASGESGALVVRGEAGIGKSALLEHAASCAEELTVLRTAGVEAESDLAFAGLFGLLRPVVDKLDELPEIQSAALRGALGLGPSTGADRFLVAAAALGLLAAAAEERPVLCLVDDAQWLDRPSADALAFAARRLQADRVAILFGARDGEPTRFEAPGLAELELGGLDEDSAAALIAQLGADVPLSVRSRLLAEAAGNPLALLELPRAFDSAESGGAGGMPESIPLTPRLQAIFRQQTDRMPDRTQAALLIAAADITGELSTVVLAADELGIGTDALDPAEAAGLIRTAGGTVTFRHPLVRSAIYEGATLVQRQRAHHALAGALSGDENADGRVWHQAMGTLTKDEEVARALAASALRSRARAAHGSAASAFLRAAELSAAADRRTTRLAAAAQAAWDAGQPDRARAAIERALPTATSELRAELLRLRGVIHAREGALHEARVALLEAFDVAADPSLKLETLFEAAEAASYSGDLAAVGELGGHAAGIAPANERDRFNLSALMGFASLYAGNLTAAEPHFDDALRRADSLEDPDALIRAANAASVAGGWGAGLPYATRAVGLARSQGLLSVLPRALQRQGGEFLWNSNFDLAFAAAEEGYHLSTDMGFDSPWDLMTMAVVEANRGHEDEARSHVEQVLAIGSQTDAAFLIASAMFTLAFLELVAGRWHRATDLLLEVAGSQHASAHPITSRAAVPDLVEAAVRAGRVAEIAQPLAGFRTWASSSPGGGGNALLARCEAMAGERPGDEAFAEAIGLEDALPAFQRGRGRLLYGEWLRRERRRQDARVHLRVALELFHRLRAVPWEERATVELRATGETARKRDPSTRDQLTAQEIQIAGLVSEGLTNRQIAARLYLSPRTIDYHLRKVFSKLGIASRSELVRHGLPER